jgi:hypothetical protein
MDVACMTPTELRRREGSLAARTALAAAEDTAPELLTWLAADPAQPVRAAVAANRGTPPQAGLVLADDPDTDVRAALARRLGAAPPGAEEAARHRRARIVSTILARLAEDVAVEVRAALAEAVADLPDAPRELILRLARDAAMPVAEPVLRLSPLLQEADLLALVAAPPAAITRRLVAARPRLGEAVADAIAASADAPAIAALLRNGSAAIREETLDGLMAAGAGRPAWQAALACRPRLPARATRALGMMIADHLLEMLAARADLPEGLAETLHRRIEARLAATAPIEAAVREAARAGDRDALLAELGAATGLPRARVEAALSLRSGRAITSLCWRAGWSATVAEEVQVALGVPRGLVVRANAEGSWSLSPSELQWQLELLEEMPAEAAPRPVMPQRAEAPPP